MKLPPRDNKMMKRKDCFVFDKLLCSYEKVHEFQLQLLKKKKLDPTCEDYLIFVEHPAVYTFGRKVKESSNLPKGVFIERGGEATFHNEGQLVCYPILSLVGTERDVTYYMRNLETILINVLKAFGLRGETKKDFPGVWISGKEKKIASVGVSISSWVTYHGSALNVNNDLNGFSKINPCGFDATVMTSIEKELHGSYPPMGKVKSIYLEQFSKVFGRDVKSISVC